MPKFLGFVHPLTKQSMTFSAPLPEDMETVRRELTNQGVHAVLTGNPTVWTKFRSMSNKEPLQPGQVVDTLGELISSLSAFAAKIPAASRMTLPGGVKPTEEAVEAYENIVYRFRDRAGATYKPLPPFVCGIARSF